MKTALIKSSLEKEINPEKDFVVFDFDNTCIKGDIAESTFNYICDNKLLKDHSLLADYSSNGDYHKKIYQYYYNLLNKGEFENAYFFLPKILSGFTPQEIKELTTKAIRRDKITIKPQVIEFMDFFKERAVDIWIVSASPEVMVETAAEHFNLPARIIGLRNQMDNQLYKRDLLKPISIAKGKVECIKKYISLDQAPLFAAGDSLNDLPMLEYAKLQLVVDRNNDLTKIAKEKNWFMINSDQ